ncbi:MAG: hypothetical protein U5R31_15800 [Acidimicrobiia bacterium]|nr:hypothetical protein [Acidimicrobiia bacterium]
MRDGAGACPTAPRYARVLMGSLLVATRARFLEHDTGAGHPERRRVSTRRSPGSRPPDSATPVVALEPASATTGRAGTSAPDRLRRPLRRFTESGGGNIDPDTVAAPASFDATLLAAGTGLEAVERLDRGEADSRVLSRATRRVTMATPARSMGFCLLNNVAVTAAALADRGERSWCRRLRHAAAATGHRTRSTATAASPTSPSTSIPSSPVPARFARSVPPAVGARPSTSPCRGRVRRRVSPRHRRRRGPFCGAVRPHLAPHLRGVRRPPARTRSRPSI